MRIWSIVALTLVALALGTTFAHVLERPAKLLYDASLYTTLQTSLYVRWGPPSVASFVEPAAILAVIVLAAQSRHHWPAWPLLAAAAAALLAAFPVAYFWRVEPANAAFWAAARSGSVPAHWEAWRARWETGHALRFVLHLTAFVLVAAAVAGGPKR
jgi:hypothetical protein